MGMTEQEAIKNALNGLKNADIKIDDEIRYPSIKALEKQVAKKPLYITTGDNECICVICPICQQRAVDTSDLYCVVCGQKFDWSDEDTEEQGLLVRKENNGWIPVSERYPENNNYILLSFENFSLPTVGRYEVDEEGGAFFVGDDDISCVSSGLYVNAWQPLPKRYEENCRFTKQDRKNK